MLSSCKNTAWEKTKCLRHPLSELGPDRSPPGAPGPPAGRGKPRSGSERLESSSLFWPCSRLIPAQPLGAVSMSLFLSGCAPATLGFWGTLMVD